MTRSIGNMKIYFTAIFWIVCCQIARASASSYSSFVINHLQGLSNSAVLSILQDNQGLMWFGTYDGLNYYDGRTIEVFRTDFSKGGHWIIILFPAFRSQGTINCGYRASWELICFRQILYP